MSAPEPKTQRERDIYLKGYRDAEKAYGACHFCYGKGYATTNEFAEGGGERRKLPVVRPCSCDRGKQIAEILGGKV